MPDPEIVTFLPSTVLAPAREHVLGKVYTAIPRRFHPDEAASKRHALAGKSAREFVAQSFVLSEQVPDLTGSHANVTCRYIGILTNVPIQFRHEGLTEAHHFAVALASGIKIGPPLSSPYGKRRERVF